MTKSTKQYYPRWTPLPSPGDIREIADRRMGKISKLARVRKVHPASRQVEMNYLKLDKNGKE